MLNTGKLAGKTIYITGASRGIGKAIALKAARDGAKIVVAAKTAEPHPKLSGTIYTAAEESKLSATSAVMSGKMKMNGNVGKAMALESLMKKMSARSYHTLSSRRTIPSSTTTLAAPGGSFASFRTGGAFRSSTTFSSVPEVFERIKNVANADIVSKVKATFVFDVSDDGKYFIDLAEGEGDAGSGAIPNKPDDFKPDVLISLSKENCLKLFNQELKPATAFMTGKLKVSGDLSKTLNLETVMKATRAERSFHTSAARRQHVPYTSVSDVRERIQKVASAKIVKDVMAIYLFDVEDEGKFYVDFKNGDGCVSEGDPPVDKKPDVVIKMNSSIFVKIFNREIAPATAFMSGKVKVSGDLTKALTLEKIMKAAREAEEGK